MWREAKGKVMDQMGTKKKERTTFLLLDRTSLVKKDFVVLFFFVPRKYHFKWLTCASDLDKKLA